VSVKDNGIGIASGTLSRVFEMFYQGGDQEKSRNAGLGIGLTLAKSLVEMHDGTITVESPGVNRGTEFEVRLPVSNALAAADTRSERHDDVPSARRVLIVDDNVDAAKALSILIKSLGVRQVRTATSGAQALQIAAELRPEVILLDLKMPEMDGYEVARLLRQETWGKDILLVAVTGWGAEEHRRRSKDAGFDVHITKPADIAALEAVLAEE
jgi:CheY-like chemotaxis protein